MEHLVFFWEPSPSKAKHFYSSLNPYCRIVEKTLRYCFVVSLSVHWQRYCFLWHVQTEKTPNQWWTSAVACLLWSDSRLVANTPLCSLWPVTRCLSSWAAAAHKIPPIIRGLSVACKCPGAAETPYQRVDYSKLCLSILQGVLILKLCAITVKLQTHFQSLEKHCG